MSKLTEADLYAKEGPAYMAAWDILRKGIRPPHYPPSLEVFKHARQVHVEKADPISVAAFAEYEVKRVGELPKKS